MLQNVRRIPVCAAAALLLAASASQASAQQTPQTPQTPQTEQTPQAQGAAESKQDAATPTPTRVFGSDAGLVLNFIKPDKTAQFEGVIQKLKEAFQKSDKPERKQQAASWKVFRAVEPAAGGNVLYVFTIDPAVKGADYTVSSILAEAFPEDVQTIYKDFADAYASGQNFVNMTLVAALGQ